MPQRNQPSQLNSTRTNGLHGVPQLDLVFIGLLAILVLLLFRLPSSRWVTALWLESALIVGLPPLMLLGVSKGFVWSRGQGSVPSGWMQLGAIACASTTVLLQFIFRQFGVGDPTEIVVLMALQFGAWYLIIFSGQVLSFKKVGFVTCCALVLFTCFMSEQVEVFVASFLFLTCALWHLLSNYWSRLDDKAIEGDSRMLPVNSIAIAISLAAIIGTATILMAVVPQAATINLSGFSPFSGGEEGYQDTFARCGIGDGDMLAAGDNARSAGPVQSDQFIEDDKPSMYDVIVEKYSAATEFKDQKKSRAAALNVRAKHLKEVIESEQSGKTFSTSRKPSSDKVLDLEHRRSKALFYVEGSTPVRFSIDCFHHFDGWDWSKVDLPENDLPRSKIRLGKEFGKPWYRKTVSPSEYLATSRAHRVKILRLNTNVLPAPSLLRAWHIDRVNLPNLFAYTPQATVEMNGDLIPTHTVIDSVSDVPNFYLLSKRKSARVAAPNSPLGQIPSNDTKSRIEQLAREWTQGHARGWQQVDAIINQLRNAFAYRPDWVATESYSDSVEAFLDQGGGPAYQFASVATQILRAAGYRARLKSGFLVSDKDFDWTAGQSIVTSENLHLWPEVCFDGARWIPLEPTPGVPKPYHQLTWSQWCMTQAAYGIGLVKQHPAFALLAVVVLGLLFRYRWELTAGLSWLAWCFMFRLFPARRLKATRRLIDLRFWAAGSPRPAFEAVSNWFCRPDPNAAQQFCHFWQIENFSRAQRASLQRESVALACRQIVSELSFKRIKSKATSEPNS
jgi:transglutaminase-like putative cysteine protease/putative Ca2+/H+ antiporter (TMEM165/GDT1 family)